MSLTVKDILEKTFKRTFKGYDEDEVDQFLDQIIDEIKDLQNKNNTLQKDLLEAKEKVEKVKETEEAIMHTMVSAQKASERILKEAARKAELVIANAESTAKQRVDQTDKELVEAERKLEAIKRSAQNFATSFANMVNAQAASFNQAYNEYFGDIDAFSSGGISMEALEKIDKDVEENLQDITQIDEAESEETLYKELKTPRFVKDESDTDTETQKIVEESAQKDSLQVKEGSRSGESDGVTESDQLDDMAKNLEEEPLDSQGDMLLATADQPENQDSIVIAEEADQSESLGDMPAALDIERSETLDHTVKEVADIQADPDGNIPASGTIELHEINKALNEFEQGEDVLPNSDEDTSSATKPDGEDEVVLAESEKTEQSGIGEYKHKYNDYSWLYENEDKADTSEFELSFKDPKEKQQLKSLIDEVID